MFYKFIKKFYTIAFVGLFTLAGQGFVSAAPLSAGTKLTVTQGTGVDTLTPCTVGSCFGMEVSPGSFVWTNIVPGTDGGLILGKDQASGGQEAGPSSALDPLNATSGEVTAAWEFFGNFGTFATVPLQGVLGVTTTGAAENIFDDVSCTSLLDCAGKTVLGSWHIAWNGVVVPLGSALGCISPACNGDEGIQSWTLTEQGVAGPDGDAYVVSYDGIVPDGDPSGFGNAAFSLILRGNIALPPPPNPLPVGTKLSIAQGTSLDTLTPCSVGSCFGMEVSPGSFVWTNLVPGTDGGLILDKDQASGGQEAGPSSALDPLNATSGEVTAAWEFFGNYGTFATIPLQGVLGATTTGNKENIFDTVSCTSLADCAGRTVLGSWHIAWNGVVVPLGSALGCASPMCNGDEGVQSWTVTEQGVAGPDGDTYEISYDGIVPDGDPSGFGNASFSLILRGDIALLPPPKPLPNGTKLSIAQGAGGDFLTPCTVGSCFGMEISPGNVVWTNFSAGTDGGLILGKNQASGGQEWGPTPTIDPTNAMPGEITAAWDFLGSYGTIATVPLQGVLGQATTGAADNVFDGVSCESFDACVGRTVLGSMHIVWNGVVVPMGSAPGCDSPFCDADEGVQSWTVTEQGPAGLDGDAYFISHDWIVPEGHPSGFSNASFSLRMRGTVEFPLPAATGVWPANAVAGELVFIFGKNFVIGDTTVTFNANPVPVFSVIDEGVIIALLPAGDTVGPIEITTSSGTVLGPLFNQGVSPLVSISGLWPGEGQVNSIYLVFGSNFLPDHQISVNGTIQTFAQYVADDLLFFLLTPGTTTGPVTVSNSTSSATSTSDLVILP